MTAPTYHEESATELADEIEHVKALILEKLDDLNSLRTNLREEHVPLTVCTHLEQCIKETEVCVVTIKRDSRSVPKIIIDFGFYIFICTCKRLQMYFCTTGSLNEF